MSRESVLRFLTQRGDYVSGEEMSRALGISRAAIWKSISALREAGYQIEAKTNRGYRLVGAPGIPSPETIRPLLTCGDFCRELICLDEVDSTSSYLKRLVASGGQHGTVAIANAQTGGRGRLGRSFASPRNKGVYMSLLLRPKVAPPEATVLTSFSAVAVCEAISAVSDVRPGIKWVNDVVAGDKKLCGILTEMAVVGELGQVDYVIIGAGVNVSHTAEDFPEDIRHRASSLALLSDEPVSRVRLAAEMINAFARMVETCFTRPAAYLERYRQLSTTVGRDILVIRGDTSREARALDIAPDCALVVRYLDDGSEEALRYGEISIRAKDGYV